MVPEISMHFEKERFLQAFDALVFERDPMFKIEKWKKKKKRWNDIRASIADSEARTLEAFFAGMGEMGMPSHVYVPMQPWALEATFCDPDGNGWVLQQATS